MHMYNIYWEINCELSTHPQLISQCKQAKIGPMHTSPMGCLPQPAYQATPCQPKPRTCLVGRWRWRTVSRGHSPSPTPLRTLGPSVPSSGGLLGRHRGPLLTAGARTSPPSRRGPGHARQWQQGPRGGWWPEPNAGAFRPRGPVTSRDKKSDSCERVQSGRRLLQAKINKHYTHTPIPLLLIIFGRGGGFWLG